MRAASAMSAFTNQTGRVIALGRAMLALLFLLTIWLDASQPAHFPNETYAALIFYVAFSIAILALTWRNWWLDARLAAPALLVDMAVFMVIVFSTHGYTSPYYLIFLLPLLTAAIRWGWRETAAVSALLVLLYLAAGLLAAWTEPFEHQRFIVRAGHLVILSTMLIAFTAHQRSLGGPWLGLFGRNSAHDDRDRPFEGALALAMKALGASSGLLLLRGGDVRAGGVVSTGGTVERIEWFDPHPNEDFPGSALADFRRDRLLYKSARNHNCFARASDYVDSALPLALGADQALLISIRAGESSGLLMLGGIDDLSGDYLLLGRDLSDAVGAYIDRHALVEAIELGASAEGRLGLARDVHDNVVQFLAGAAFRVEALRRSAADGKPVAQGLDELKRLIVEEQADIRGFVSTLRREPVLAFGETVEGLRQVAGRLGRQWQLDCRFDSAPAEAGIPIKLHLDLQQLLREAVANAARHGGARKVEAKLSLDQDNVVLEVADDGCGFENKESDEPRPWSLKERVDRAGGSMLIVTATGRTVVSVTLPLGRDAA